jgi:hypothetical protein
MISFASTFLDLFDIVLQERSARRNIKNTEKKPMFCFVHTFFGTHWGNLAETSIDINQATQSGFSPSITIQSDMLDIAVGLQEGCVIPLGACQNVEFRLHGPRDKVFEVTNLYGFLHVMIGTYEEINGSTKHEVGINYSRQYTRKNTTGAGGWNELDIGSNPADVIYGGVGHDFSNNCNEKIDHFLGVKYRVFKLKEISYVIDFNSTTATDWTTTTGRNMPPVAQVVQRIATLNFVTGYNFTPTIFSLGMATQRGYWVARRVFENPICFVLDGGYRDGAPTPIGTYQDVFLNWTGLNGGVTSTVVSYVLGVKGFHTIYGQTN